MAQLQHLTFKVRHAVLGVGLLDNLELGGAAVDLEVDFRLIVLDVAVEYDQATLTGENPDVVAAVNGPTEVLLTDPLDAVPHSGEGGVAVATVVLRHDRLANVELGLPLEEHVCPARVRLRVSAHAVTSRPWTFNCARNAVK